VASGLPVDKFSFYGFLPVKKGRRSSVIEQIATDDKTAFVFVSPHKIAKVLEEIAEIIGTETEIAIIREATKVYEEVIRGTVSQIINDVTDKKWKGECVIAVFPGKKKRNAREAKKLIKE